MTLTAEQVQRYKTLDKYGQALEKTQETYARLLETPTLSIEDKDDIWSTSFTLQYRIESNNKYITLLTLLEATEKRRATLGRLCEKLTINPSEDLQGFIAQAETIMQSDEFKSELTMLKHTGEGLGPPALALLVSAGLFSIAIAIVMCHIAPALILIPFMLAVSASYAFLCGSIEEDNSRSKVIKCAIISLYAEEPKNISTKRKYVHQTRDTEGNISGSITEKHEIRPTAELKNNFFKPQMDHIVPLHTEVQEQYNLLSRVNI